LSFSPFCPFLAARAKAIVAAKVGEEFHVWNFRNRIGSMTLPAFLLAPLSLEALVEPLDSISVDYSWMELDKLFDLR